MSESPAGQRHDRTALITYGSETGNAEDVAEALGHITKRLRFQTAVVEMNATDLQLLTKFTLVILVISTTGQGDFPANSRKFWKSLLPRRLTPETLSGVSFTTFGLGDTSYTKFNWAARKLHKRLEQLGASELYARGEADERHEEGTDGAFLPWSLDLKKFLLQQFPLPHGLSPISESEPLPPKWIVELVDPIPVVTDRQSSEPASPVDISPLMDGPLSSDALEVIKGPIEDDKTGRLSPPPVRSELLPIENSFPAICQSNDRITAVDHWQDVRLIEFEIPAQFEQYRPGAVLTVYPKNFDDDVDRLIVSQGWSDVADKIISVQASGKVLGTPSFIPSVRKLPTVLHPTLRSLLRNNLDINAIPRRTFFEHIALFASDADQKERILEFTNPVYGDEFFDYTTRTRRTILEVLHDFSSVKIPWNLAPSIFPPLRGRQFSVSSGGFLKHSVGNNEEPQKVFLQICVAIVRYRTVLMKPREGVCSRYLAALRPGTPVNATMHHSESFRIMDQQLLAPMILIGPGTGIAPMRALLYERSKLQSLGHTVKDALVIYGGRNEAKDFLFENEWKLLEVEIITAFSRDQKQKIYVQDRIREKSDIIFDALVTGASVFVCGSSGNMPIAVRKALLDCITSGMRKLGQFREDTEARAETYLAYMEKDGRYIQETW